MSSLEDIIDSPANLEVKRALAVKMIIFDFKTEDIVSLFDIQTLLSGCVRYGSVFCIRPLKAGSNLFYFTLQRFQDGPNSFL